MSTKKNRQPDYSGVALDEHVDAPLSRREPETDDAPTNGNATTLNALRQIFSVAITLMNGDSKPEDKLARADLIVVPLQMKLTGFSIWQPKGQQTELGVTGPGYNWTVNGKTVRIHIAQPLDPNLKGIPSPVRQLIVAAYYEATRKVVTNAQPDARD